MPNLGSSTTPIKGEQFELPDGHSFDVDNGDLVWKDSNGSIFARYDEANSEFVIDSISATSVSSDSGTIDTLEVLESFNNADLTQAESGETLFFSDNPPNMEIGSASAIDTIEVDTVNDLTARTNPTIAYIRETDSYAYVSKDSQTQPDPVALPLAYEFVGV